MYSHLCLPLLNAKRETYQNINEAQCRSIYVKSYVSVVLLGLKTGEKCKIHIILDGNGKRYHGSCMAHTAIYYQYTRPSKQLQNTNSIILVGRYAARHRSLRKAQPSVDLACQTTYDTEGGGSLVKRQLMKVTRDTKKKITSRVKTIEFVRMRHSVSRWLVSGAGCTQCISYYRSRLSI